MFDILHEYTYTYAIGGALVMAQKTIYVSEADLPLFDQAQTLSGGNLSATIAKALRRYIEESNQGNPNLQTFEVKVGKVAYSLKRFKARLLARGLVTSDESGSQPTVRLTAFETERGKIALHTQTSFSLAQTIFQNLGSFVDISEGEYHFEIVDSLEDLKSRVHSEFYNAVKAALEGVDFEVLDI